MCLCIYASTCQVLTRRWGVFFFFWAFSLSGAQQRPLNVQPVCIHFKGRVDWRRLSISGRGVCKTSLPLASLHAAATPASLDEDFRVRDGNWGRADIIGTPQRPAETFKTLRLGLHTSQLDLLFFIAGYWPKTSELRVVNSMAFLTRWCPLFK